MKTHKRLRAWGIAAAAIITLRMGALADPIIPPGPGFDEFGNGLFPFAHVQSLKVTDPSGGVPEQVLLYLLPLTPTPGDVVLTEPGSSDWSDVLRFTSVPGFGSVLIYYSNGDDGRGLPADVGSMPSLMSNHVTIEEGPHDLTFYFPLRNQPGFVEQLGSLRYGFYGDNVANFPDGGTTITLLGIGLTGLLFIARQKK